jgi:hypothetical protein
VAGPWGGSATPNLQNGGGRNYLVWPKPPPRLLGWLGHRNHTKAKTGHLGFLEDYLPTWDFFLGGLFLPLLFFNLMLLFGFDRDYLMTQGATTLCFKSHLPPIHYKKNGL